MVRDFIFLIIQLTKVPTTKNSNIDKIISNKSPSVEKGTFPNSCGIIFNVNASLKKSPGKKSNIKKR